MENDEAHGVKIFPLSNAFIRTRLFQLEMIDKTRTAISEEGLSPTAKLEAMRQRTYRGFEQLNYEILLKGLYTEKQPF